MDGKRTSAKKQAEHIRSSGFVVDTLEAALWSFLTTDPYKDAVLKAVNLGEDTDTTGAVTGALAATAYGLDAIPEEWIAELQGRDQILHIAHGMAGSLRTGPEDRQANAH